MKRLHLFVIRSFFGPFFMTFFISIFVLLMQFVWKFLDDFVGKGLETSILIELMVYAASGLIPLALPLSMLLASLMTFGNLGENNELLAMKAAGVSLLKIMKPLLVLSSFMVVGAFFFSNNVVPYTNQKFYALAQSIRQQKPELIVKEGIFSSDLEDISIKVGRKDKKNNMLYDILIYDHRNDDENTNVTVADSGMLKVTEDKQNIILTLYSGTQYSELKPDKRRRRRKSEKTYPSRRDKFGAQTMIVPIKGFGFERRDEDAYKSLYKSLPTKQLAHNRDSLLEKYNRFRDIRINRYKYNSILTDAISERMRPDSLKQTEPDYEDSENEENLQTDLVAKAEMSVINVDSIFLKQDCKMKSAIVVEALKNARKNQNALVRNRNDFRPNYVWLRKHEIELFKKFTLSLACLIFFFIGAPLGAIIRKGGLGMPVVISVFLFIIYYIVSMIAEKSAREGGLTIVEGMWTSSVVFLLFGIFLTYKAANDSVILNLDTYLSFFKKLLPKKLVKNVFQREMDDADTNF